MTLVQKTVRLKPEQVKWIEEICSKYGIDDFSKALRLVLYVCMNRLKDTVEYYIQELAQIAAQF